MFKSILALIWTTTTTVEVVVVGLVVVVVLLLLLLLLLQYYYYSFLTARPRLHSMQRGNKMRVTPLCTTSFLRCFRQIAQIVVRHRISFNYFGTTATFLIRK